MSEALIFASINPQYDDRLFIDLRVQYMKIASSEHVVYIDCSDVKTKQITNCVHSMYWTRKSMNNLSSYCGLVDARLSASEKDLPVKSPIPLSTEAIAANVAAESRVSVKGAKNKTLAGLMQKNKADL